jgi:hypothetical protein
VRYLPAMRLAGTLVAAAIVTAAASSCGHSASQTPVPAPHLTNLYVPPGLTIQDTPGGDPVAPAGDPVAPAAASPTPSRVCQEVLPLRTLPDPTTQQNNELEYGNPYGIGPQPLPTFICT